MCESSAYLKQADGKEELILEDVVGLVPREGKIILTDILGEQKEMQAEIDHIDLLHHRIVLKRSMPV